MAKRSLIKVSFQQSCNIHIDTQPKPYRV